jgi:hypothetical protein
MKSPQIDEISAIAERLAPDTPFLLHQRLFSERYMNLLEGKGEIKKQMEDLKNRQQSALKEVAASGGMEAVLAFAQAVESPWRVGIAFGSIAEINIDNSILPALLVSENKSLAQFVGGFIWGRYHQQGWEWVDKVNTSDWTLNENAKFFSFLPFTQEAWQRVEKVLGEEQASYWENVPVNPYDANTGLDYGIEKLIQYGRLYQAINCLSKILYEKQPMDSKLAIRALLEALKSSEKPNSMGLHDAVDVIKALQDNSQIDPDDLFKIEWAYLPLLDDHHDATPNLLWHRLANDPAFFSEVIRAVYRSRKEKDTNKEISEEKKQIATNAYQLLSEWHRPPGLRDDGSYDGDALNVWVDAVTKECSETGHLETAMTMIGHVLRYAPSDPDGLWIHRSVAKVLNGKGAKDMRIGFHSELYNSRGVHWVDPSGKQEMELAAENRKRANEVESAGYPRLAATLRDIANEYEHEAERIVSRKLMDED